MAFKGGRKSPVSSHVFEERRDLLVEEFHVSRNRPGSRKMACHRKGADCHTADVGHIACGLDRFILGVEEVVLILRILTGLSASDADAAQADVNQDGRVDLVDAVYALQAAAGVRP